MLVITLAITAAFLCSCTLPDYRTSDTDGNGKIQVLCTDFPQYDWARNIIGRTDKIELSMLFKNGADAHSYQPSANDIIRITHSALLIYNGGASDESIEDILDSGMTLSYITGLLRQREPSSIRLCTLLDKPERRRADVSADYFGFVVPDEFVVGYGLDYAEKYRNLPYVGILKPEVYSE